MGMPYSTNQYLPHLRMKAAKKVIREGWSTRQVARYTGYNQSREWIKSSSEAEIRAKNQNYHELKQVTEKIGTNRLLLNRKVQMDFSEPWRFAPQFREELRGGSTAAPQARLEKSSQNLQSFVWSQLLNAARTFFEQNP